MFRVVIVGGCAVDETYRATSPEVSNNKMLGTSTPCKFLFRAAGGVGRNLADVLRKLLPEEFYSVQLISTVGTDTEGTFVLQSCRDANIGTKNIVRLDEQTKMIDTSRHIEFKSDFDVSQEEIKPTSANTAKYVAILDGRGELATAAAAMTIFESQEFYNHIGKCADELLRASAIIIDTNLSALHFQKALELAKRKTSASSTQFKVIAIDPISIEKGRRVVPVLMRTKEQRQIINMANNNSDNNHSNSNDSKQTTKNFVTIMKPNHFEASAMTEEVLTRIDQSVLAGTSIINKKLREHLPRNFLMKTNVRIHEDINYNSFDHDELVDDASNSKKNACLRTLHEAARNAVILIHFLQLDVVMVSCGPNGSMLCFSSKKKDNKDTMMRNNKKNDGSSDNQSKEQNQNASSSSSNKSEGTNNTNNNNNNSDADMELLEFTRHWQHVPLTENTDYYVRWFPAIRVRRVQKVTGAGDTHFGSFISHLLMSMTLPKEFNNSLSAVQIEDDDDDDEDDHHNHHQSHHHCSKSNEKNSSCSSSKAVNNDHRHLIWSELAVHMKGHTISNAVQHATANASLALQTKKGATPQLVKLLTRGAKKRSKL